MSDPDYLEFAEYYRDLRCANMTTELRFVILWRPKLDQFELADLKKAVIEVVADERARFPLNDLPLLIQYAENIRDKRTQPERIRKQQEALTYEQPEPFYSIRYEIALLRTGILTQEQFDERARVAKERGLRTASA